MKSLTFKQNFDARLGYDNTVGLFYKNSYVGKCLTADCKSGSFTATALEFLSMCEADQKSFIKSKIKKAFNEKAS